MANNGGIKTGAWLTESLRWSSFLSRNTPVPANSWWSDLVGGQPEASVFRPEMGLQQQEGPFASGRLSLIVLPPNRIDWHLNAAPGPAGTTSLGSFEEAIGSFRPLLLRWFEICPSVARVALGAVLIQPVLDLPTGLRLLSRYLKDSVRIEPEACSEFTYTINRPRQSRSAELGFSLNRLSKWSVPQVQTIQIAAGLGSPQAALVRSQYVCRLELDLNTPAELEDGLSKEQLPAIFDELVSLGEEIAHRGDIP